MKTNGLRSKMTAFALSLMLIAMLAAAMAMPQVALAKGGGSLPRHQGFITAKPASGIAGTWVIGGKSFRATSATQVDQTQGRLAIGVCTKVKYQVVNGVNQAVELDSEPAADCR